MSQTRPALLAGASRRMRAVVADDLYRSSFFLMLNAGLTALLGFAYWTLAAHYYGPTSVGLATAVVSAATLVGSLGYLGFDYALLRFLPSSARAWDDSNTGLTVTGAGSLVLGGAYLVVASLFVPKLAFLTQSGWWAAGFLLLCLMTTWNYITNCIFIARTLARYVLLSSIAFCVIRLPLAGLLSGRHQAGLVAGWTVGLVAGTVLSFYLLHRNDRYVYRPVLVRSSVRRLRSYAGASYLSNIFGRIAPLVLPTIIGGTLGPRYAAYFYVVYLMTVSLNMIPTAVSQSLLAAGAADEAALGAKLGKAARAIAALMIPAIAVLALVGYPVLSLFGHEYAVNGIGCLLLLCLTAVPKMGSYLFITVLRVRNEVRPTIGIAVASTVVALVGSFLGLHLAGSLTTVGLAFFASELVVCAASGYLVLRRHPEVVRQALGRS